MTSPEILPEFQKIQMFEHFPSHFKEAMVHAAHWIATQKDEVLLSQGSLNKKLYFLIKGRLGVRVDHLLVNYIENPGELVGEMSVISGQPASATITSEMPSSIISVDLERVRSILKQERDLFDSYLYKAVILSLSEKLRATNQKAKYFEEFSQKQWNEIQKSQQIALKKLSDISDVHVQKIKSDLMSLKTTQKSQVKISHEKNQTANGSQVNEVVNDIENEINKIDSVIYPLVRKFKGWQSRQTQKVLLIEPSKREQSIAKMSLGGTGIQLKIASNPEEAKEILKKEKINHVFLSSDLLDVINDLGDLEGIQFTLLMSENIQGHFNKLKFLKKFPNIVSRNSKDRVLTAKNMVTTLTKLASGDIFGLEKYLIWGADLQVHPVKGSENRKEINQIMQEYFLNLGVRSSKLDSVKTVAEELLMNAVYDAPRGSDGKALYNHLNRTEKIDLSPEHYSQFSFGTDGSWIGISVSDPFGSLDGKVIVNYLESVYQNRAGSLNQQKGGAGRGLHMIVEMSDLVIFNLKPQVKTEVIALFSLENKEREEQSLNTAKLHYFVES
jgi:CRP-like cAMP-binding protein